MGILSSVNSLDSLKNGNVSLRSNKPFNVALVSKVSVQLSNTSIGVKCAETHYNSSKESS